MMRMTRRIGLLALTLLLSCADSQLNDPKTVTETGYLSCSPNDAACPGEAQCVTDGGLEVCVSLPDACDGVLSCDCLGNELCGALGCDDNRDGNSFQCISAVGLDSDGDGTPDIDDCQPNNAEVHPGAEELCDGIDNNCVDGIDEGCGVTLTLNCPYGEGYEYPVFDASCEVDADCALVFHQLDCCGNAAAVGLNSSESEAFHQAETMCIEQKPQCDCVPPSIAADDGQSSEDLSAFAVQCDAGQCRSFVVSSPFPESAICSETGGTWDPTSCGHWICGQQPPCDAIDPGCNCGAGKSFVADQGCVEDLDCPAPPTSEQTLCVDTGGTWDPTSCGHWDCGQQPDCDAIDPGCNCGDGKSFVADQGCVTDATCGQTASSLCNETGGSWMPNSCGHWNCGEAPTCEADSPGCNCGAGKNFDAVQGCQVDPSCSASSEPESLCTDTGGTWDPTSCGHWNCGDQPACDAIIPGCNCGAGANFDPAQGCQSDPSCTASSEPESLCTDTGGTWDPTSCGHWVCGQQPPCDAIDPGCNCGAGQSFVAGQGCVADPNCAASSEPQALCEQSGGNWMENSCGDWTCGEPPICLAIIPGCNCGAGKNYVAGSGCAADLSCGGTACDENSDCSSSQYCDFPAGACGQLSSVGVCAEKPDACEVGEAPLPSTACGCNGELYLDPCHAAAAGSDAMNFSFGGCDMKAEANWTYACGDKFCWASSEYCEISINDVGPATILAECMPVPDGCNAMNAPTCDCVEPGAAAYCTDVTGYIMVLYPGG